ncbi:MAG: Crp/Fnr family transcriptional regulator [Bacteroidia bacterium]|nr:Crp/Fnr family transcriptional regulator [Bacteroidia bacterium]
MSNFPKFKNWLTQVSFLTEEDCVMFEPFLRTKTYRNKSFFLVEGNICKEIGFINSGGFRTFYLQDGKEINTQFVFENQFVVDYDSFLQEKRSRYFIQATEDAEVVTFSLNTLQNAYQQSQNWERFGRIMAEESYKIVTRRVESFLFLDGKQRYQQLLENEPYLFDRLPLYHIASYLGLERESLSRLRRKMVNK